MARLNKNSLWFLGEFDAGKRTSSIQQRRRDAQVLRTVNTIDKYDPNVQLPEKRVKPLTRGAILTGSALVGVSAALTCSLFIISAFAPILKDVDIPTIVSSIGFLSIGSGAAGIRVGMRMLRDY